MVHGKTRRVVEVIKNSWQVLDYADDSLCYSPAKLAKIIISCFMLNNNFPRNGTLKLDTHNLISSLGVKQRFSKHFILQTHYKKEIFVRPLDGLPKYK